MYTLSFIMLLHTAAIFVTGEGMFFKAEAVKGYGNSKPDRVLETYYIPDKQCSGVVHNLTQACEGLNVVQIRAVDAQAYPEVSIDALLERAAVRRRAGARGCVGRVPVHVAVGCGDVAVRSVRALLDFPLAQSRKLPPM